MHPASPIDPSERIGTIDILRGIALFIVLIINTATEFRVSIFEQFLPGTKAAGLAGQLSEAVILALHTRGFILFSFLFGVGLAIQFERLAGDTSRFTLMVRRLAILLAIGVIHLFLIWNGDILTEYAIVGFAALPFLYGPRWLLAAASALSLGLYLASPLLPPIVSFPDGAWISHHVGEARQAYGAGSFMEILAFRVDEVRYIAPLHIYALPRTLGLFLLGALVWRTGFFRATAPRKFLVAAACSMLAIGAWLTIAAARGEAFGWQLNWPGGAVFRSLAQLVLAGGYGAAIVVLADHATGRRIDYSELDILWLWSCAFRAAECPAIACGRARYLRGTGGSERVVAQPFQIRPRGMAVAFTDVRRTPARCRASSLAEIKNPPERRGAFRHLTHPPPGHQQDPKATGRKA